MSQEIVFERLRYGIPTGIKTYGVKQALSDICIEEANQYNDGQLERTQHKFDRLLQYVAALTETLHERLLLTDAEVVELLGDDYRINVSKLP